MILITAWQKTDDVGPQLVAAYDQNSFENWGGVPEWYEQEIYKAQRNGEVRELMIAVDGAAVDNLFQVSQTTGVVSDNGSHLRVVTDD